MEITNQQLAQIRSIFPEAQIETDNDGQVIVYTGTYLIQDEEDSIQPLGEPNSRPLEWGF